MNHESMVKMMWSLNQRLGWFAVGLIFIPAVGGASGSFAQYSRSDRLAVNRIIENAVNSIGCSDAESRLRSQKAAFDQQIPEQIRNNPTYLKNLIWDYSHKRYGSFSSRYERSTNALIQLFSGGSDSSRGALTQAQSMSWGCPGQLTAKSEVSETPSRQAERIRRAEPVDQIPDLWQSIQQSLPTQGRPIACESQDSSATQAFSGSPDRTRRLIATAREGTRVRRNGSRNVIGRKSPSVPATSTGLCSMYVSVALESAGCADPRAGGKSGHKIGDFKRGEAPYAAYLGPKLAQHGFINKIGTYRSAQNAPAGAVLVYEGQTYGHAEIKGYGGEYIWDMIQDRGTGRWSMEGRRLIGIWVKPQCGAGA